MSYENSNRWLTIRVNAHILSRAEEEEEEGIQHRCLLQCPCCEGFLEMLLVDSDLKETELMMDLARSMGATAGGALRRTSRLMMDRR